MKKSYILAAVVGLVLLASAAIYAAKSSDRGCCEWEEYDVDCCTKPRCNCWDGSSGNCCGTVCDEWGKCKRKKCIRTGPNC